MVSLAGPPVFAAPRLYAPFPSAHAPTFVRNCLGGMYPRSVTASTGQSHECTTPLCPAHDEQHEGTCRSEALTHPRLVSSAKTSSSSEGRAIGR